MQLRTSGFSSKMKDSENPKITRVPVGVHRTEIWEGVSREDPGICPLESIRGKLRPQTQVPGLRHSSCEPPPHAISPGLQPACCGWWGSAGPHTPPSSCPQSWDRWAPRHRRVAYSPPQCLGSGERGDRAVTQDPKKANTT